MKLHHGDGCANVHESVPITVSAGTGNTRWSSPRLCQFNKSSINYKVSSAYRMNIPPLIPLKQTDVAKYLPQAIELTLTGRIAEGVALTRQQKVIISKIFKNLNTICKLNVKEVKQVIKAEPAYQQALGDLYFDKRINNYMLITSYEKPVEKQQKVLLQTNAISHPGLVCGIEYRIEFIISNIAKKNVMRPVILLVFNLKNGESVQIYYNLQQFSQLRAKIAGAMKQVYGIQLRAL